MERLALHRVARDGRAADVAALLAGGADVNEPKPSGATAPWIDLRFELEAGSALEAAR